MLNFDFKKYFDKLNWDFIMNTMEAMVNFAVIFIVLVS